MRCVVLAVMMAGLASMALTASADARGWHFGARGGVAMSTLRGDFADVAEPDLRLSPTGGVFAEAELASTLGIQVEALYVTKGADFEGEGVDENGDPVRFDSHLILTYVDVPVLLRVNLPGSTSLAPYVVGGPTFGFGLDATAETDGFPDVDYSDDLKTLDLGVLVGLGLRMPMGGARVDVEARYGTGFSDLWDISNNLESINQGFSVTLAVSR